MNRQPMAKSNDTVGHLLSSVADLLEDQGANDFRVRAWRGAAKSIRDLDRPVSEIFAQDGLEGLDRIPGVGAALARAIREIVQTGRLSMYERLLGESDPLARIASVPGVGRKLAQAIHVTLGIESLEELERAANDGRLDSVAGFGAKRVAGIRDALATRLRSRRPPPPVAAEAPSVTELLDVDREYRERAAGGSLPTIAPRRFNPASERWLPIMHTVRGVRHYTALFSNTAMAHRVGRTHDWVVLYYDDHDGEHQCTVVTSHRGPLAGRRVVRGREAECVTHHHLNAPRSLARRPAFHDYVTEAGD
jgi:DNA polymerase (family 10)